MLIILSQLRLSKTGVAQQDDTLCPSGVFALDVKLYSYECKTFSALEFKFVLQFSSVQLLSRVRLFATP